MRVMDKCMRNYNCPSTLSKFRNWKPGIWPLNVVPLSTGLLRDNESGCLLSQGDTAIQHT